MPKLSIVIPCYNEEKTIKKILKKVTKAKLPMVWEREIIVVDDGSKDNTKEILKTLKNKIKLIFKEKNEGKGAALKKGFKAVTGDYILIQDADLEYNPDDYIKLLQPILNNKTKIVFGSRNLKKGNIRFNWLYFYGNLFLSEVFNLLFGTKFTDVSTCYKLFPKKVIPELIQLSGNDFVFDVIELTYQLTKEGKIIEVPINYKARTKKEGKKINWRHGVKCLILMLKIKFRTSL